MFTISNLNKIYGNGNTSNHVLKNLNFTINEKEILSITGASGSGKTTLMNILAAIDNDFTGSVNYNGKELSELNHAECRKLRLNEFGFIFQAFHLISTLTVHENIIISATAKNKNYDKYLYDDIIFRCGLKDKLDSYPHQLSGGEQQRTAIARAVLSKPNVIFADEPTGNLDSENAENIFELLSGYVAEHSCNLIYVTHEIKFNHFSNKNIVLADGVIQKNNGDKNENF